MQSCCRSDDCVVYVVKYKSNYIFHFRNNNLTILNFRTFFIPMLKTTVGQSIKILLN